MEESRRDFLKMAFVTGAPVIPLSGCLSDGENYERIEQLYLDTDIDEAQREIAGTEIHVNVRAYAEDDDLEELEVQYTEPGEEVWQVLTEEGAEENEAEVVEPFNGETSGTYEFRTVAYLEGEEQVISDEEEVKFF